MTDLDWWGDQGWESFVCRKVPFIYNGFNYVTDVLIETGTDRGLGVANALAHGFGEVHTVDICRAAVQKVRQVFSRVACVHVHQGDSRNVLPNIIDATKRTTFFLDAHSRGQDEPDDVVTDTWCPLLDELRIIDTFKWKTPPLIVIDDTENIVEQKRDDWPTRSELFVVLVKYTVEEYVPPQNWSSPPNVMYCRPR